MGAEENAKREQRGVDVLASYREVFDAGEDWETVASDLFADLFHAAAGRFNYELALDRARGHFYEELREQPQPWEGHRFQSPDTGMPCEECCYAYNLHSDR